MTEVCAVVVTYNRFEFLKKCLASLKAQSVPCDILVINNASTDGTAEFLDASSDIFHIHLEENTGGAGGFNTGMREAVNRGYRYVWVMDDDTMPHPDALEKLLEADRILDGRYGWLSSLPLWTDGKICRMNRQKLSRYVLEDISFLRCGLLRSKQATFVGLFLKKEMILKAGLPIREFFIWGDDIEFTRRLAIRRKEPCYIAGQSIAVHAMKENCGSNIALDRAERLERYNYAFRNENYLFRKEGICGFLYYFAKCGKNIACSLVQAKDHRAKRVWIIIKQMILGLFFNPTIEFVEETS